VDFPFRQACAQKLAGADGIRRAHHCPRSGIPRDRIAARQHLLRPKRVQPALELAQGLAPRLQGQGRLRPRKPTRKIIQSHAPRPHPTLQSAQQPGQAVIQPLE
jgi:hypothetical protein